MTQAIKIVVVGGGTAGWMAAAYLSKKGCEVTLVESPDVAPVGVGESTLPAMNQFCQELGLNESDWMPQSNSVHKLGIKHVGWKPDSEWWHWFVYDRNRDADQIDYINSNTLPPIDNLEYAYHVDADKFGITVAKPIALANGCVHITDHIVSLELDNVGGIDYIIGRSGNEYKAEYYVDCTGFAKVLSRAVGTVYEPYTELINDRALVCTQPALDTPNRYTTTYRKSAGWIWELSLTNRRGTGYVYSSEYITDADAIDEYCAHYPGTDKSKIRVLNYTPEKCLNPFNKNVIAVGLSSGFIEPLEATSLFLTQYNITLFYRVISEKKIPITFNRLQTKLVDEIYLFILAHYTLIADDSNDYWQHYQLVEARLDTLATARKFAAEPDVMSWKVSRLFFPYSWWAMLKGYGIDQ